MGRSKWNIFSKTQKIKIVQFSFFSLFFISLFSFVVLSDGGTCPSHSGSYEIDCGTVIESGGTPTAGSDCGYTGCSWSSYFSYWSYSCTLQTRAWHCKVGSCGYTCDNTDVCSKIYSAPETAYITDSNTANTFTCCPVCEIRNSSSDTSCSPREDGTTEKRCNIGNLACYSGTCCVNGSGEGILKPADGICCLNSCTGSNGKCYSSGVTYSNQYCDEGTWRNEAYVCETLNGGIFNDAINNCCGDDTTDEGYTSGDLICIKNSAGSWEWKDSSIEPFSFYAINYNNLKFDIVSLGKSKGWKACNATGVPAQFSGSKSITNLDKFTTNSQSLLCYKQNDSYAKFGVCSSGKKLNGETGINFSIGTKVPFINFDRWSKEGIGNSEVTKTESTLKFQKEDASGVISYYSNQPSLTDWTGYDLAFDATFTNKYFPLRLKITDSSGGVIFDDLISQSAIGNFDPTGKNYVKIDLSGKTKNNINNISFYTNLDELDSGDHFVKIENLYLDGADTKYCGGTNGWISDLDSGDPTGQTCRNTGFNWTGSKCCGDEVETIAGDTDGCYKGEFVGNDATLSVFIN